MEGEPDKSKKVCAAGLAHQGMVESKEASGLGSPGVLVGAKDGAHQEP